MGGTLMSSNAARVSDATPLYAIIPAAGQSTRMGRPKLLLPVGNTTVIETVIAALRAAGIERVLVVTAAHSSSLISLAETSGAEVCAISEPTRHMRATVEEGFRYIEDNYHPTDDHFWLLIPADHPLVRPSTVDDLLKARREQPRFSIYIPTYEGRRGHPAMISWKHVNGVRASPPDHGINTYLRTRRDDTLEVPVKDPSILVDLDETEDYERLLSSSITL
jgi:molybdenum cofactor cytidylyltransferase